MTPDERKLLEDLAEKFTKTPAPPRDAEAEEFIRKHIGARPDALYMMTQTVLIQNIALQNAEQRIRDLEARGGVPAQSGSSFLGGQQYQAPQYQAPPPQTPQYQAAPQTVYAAPNPGGGSSFLRGAAQTAAGVAAGELLFSGIESLFSHPHYGGFGGFGGPGFTGGGMPGETVVNNYYDNPADARDSGRDAGYDANYDANSDDLAPADDSGQFDDSAQADDAGYDSGDSGGGFDDSGSFNV